MIEVSPRPVERVLSVVGRVRPVNLLAVRSTNPGQVIGLLHNDGDIVAAGEPLAIVRSDVERAQTEADRARLRSALAAADVARRDVARFNSLVGTGAVSAMAVDQARSTMQATQADADAALATARASAERTHEFTIRAPMAGTILARVIDNSQVVATSTTLFELGSLRGEEIRADRQPNAIVVPRQAILDAANGPKVYVIDVANVERVRAVTVASWPSLNAIIESGLRSGDRVVAAPAGTRPAARVRPVKSPPQTGS